MSDSFSFIEIAGQHVELLPARTVLSMINKAGGHCGGDGGRGGDGGDAYGGIGINLLNIDLLGGDQTNSAANATGGNGGSANGGGCWH